jgi:UDP-N-acetylglucosamine transferase subunit ALG13
VAASRQARRPALCGICPVIFLTVGVQLPFDRLVRAVDQWAGERKRSDVFAQIGHSDYKPQHLKFSAHVTPSEYRDLVERADLMIAHAGIGSIITALECGKPIIIMPRRASLKEHRNDHQLATVRKMLTHGTVNVAADEFELIGKLDQVIQTARARPTSLHANPELIARIAAFIAECSKR